MNAQTEFDFSPTGIFSLAERMGYAESLENVSARSGVDMPSLGQQLSMHLPRLTREAISCEVAVVEEAGRLAQRLCSLRQEYKPDVKSTSIPPLSSISGEVIDPPIAAAIFDRYHYLLSHRQDSFSMGLKANSRLKWPFVIASLSPFDLENLVSGAPLFQRRGTVLVLSRVFAFPWAPRNSISYLLKRIRSYVRNAFPDVTLLVTYVNPNVGFRGTSYRADNWSRIGGEVGTRYLYVDGNYRTDRSLVEEYGTASIPALSSQLGQRFQVSRYALKPLTVLTRSLRKGVLIPESSVSFPRWSPIES